MSPTTALLDEIADLFALDVQTGPVHEFPITMNSEDCTNDTCTRTCSGCSSDGDD